MENDIIYYGQTKCSKEGCNNKAYYIDKSEEYKCGVHCRKKEERIELPKLPIKDKMIKDEERYMEEVLIIHKLKAENQLQNKAGKIICSKLRMMKEPESHPGFLKVFPNFKHQNRKDGFGCSSLSPMSLGPVYHDQPGLPPSLNIENFHQGSKCFKEEVDKEGNPSELFYANRLNWYNDPVPHRHKYVGKDAKNKNIPLFFVWQDKDEHHLSYIESRQFYCTFYERLTRDKEDFIFLKNLVRSGTNIQICGYDAREIQKENIEREYLNPDFPFGHELVLFTLLVENEENYPWRKYKSFKF